MSINRNNYEAFFLDYRENNLTPEQVAELVIFLEQNPDLKEEFESFETIQMVPDKNIRFEVKESLKKNNLIPTDNIGAGNYDTYMVADLEGDLSEEESLELKAFISLNPKTKLEYNIFRSTFLKPEKAIQFKDKEQLKKSGLFVLYRTQLYYTAAIAASITILLGVYFGFVRKPDEQKVIMSVEKQGITPITNDVDTLQIPSMQPDQQKVLNFADQNQNQVKIVKTEITPGTKLYVNFRMASITSSEVRPVQTNDFSFLEIRNNETVLAKALENSPHPDAEQKSFISRFIGGLAGKVIKVGNPRRKSFLEYTIEGYNLMADKNVMLEKEVDKTGKVIAYSLNGENISFSRNKNIVNE